MQTLRAVFDENQLPDGASEIIPIFLATYHGQSRGTLQDEMGQKRSEQPHRRNISDEALKLMQDWVKLNHSPTGPPGKVTTLPCARRSRQRFEALKGGNSYVTFEDSGGDITAVGTILRIFEFNGETYFAIRRHRQLSSEDALFDIFRQLPSAGYLVYRAFEDDLALVPFSRIRSHLAKTSLELSELGIKISSPCFHVLPLPIGN